MHQTAPSTGRATPSASWRCLALATAVALVVVVLDMLSKWFVTRELGPVAERSSIQLIGRVVELHYGLNSGVAFGLLSGSSTLAGALVGVVFVPLGVVLFLLARRGAFWAIAAGLVLGGAAGNLIDRVGDGTVIDFISVGRWPTFNLADSAITVGALLLICLSFYERDEGDDPR